MDIDRSYNISIQTKHHITRRSLLSEDEESWYDDRGATLFMILVAIKTMIAMVGIIGNSIVIYASIKDRQSVVRSFRYLNRVVRSLAIADFLYSLVGQPFDILYWYYNLTNMDTQLRENKQTWILSLMTVPQDMTAGVSCFHVALIVFLRCLCLLQPMTFDKLHNRLSTIFITGIWISMLLITLCPVASAYYDLHYNIAITVESTVSIGVPVILTAIFSLLKLYILRKRRKAKESDNDINTSGTTISHGKRKTLSVPSDRTSLPSQQKALERMTKIVAIGTLICYTPDVIFRLYLADRRRQNLPVYTAGDTGTVLFYFFAKLGIQMAKIINPFIYATTIPQFKKLALKYLGARNSEGNQQFRFNTPDVSRSNYSTNKSP